MLVSKGRVRSSAGKGGSGRWNGPLKSWSVVVDAVAVVVAAGRMVSTGSRTAVFVYEDGGRVGKIGFGAAVEGVVM